MEYIGTSTLFVDIRPVRCCYLVRAGSTEDFVKAVGLASGRWGGGRELIVPITPEGEPDSIWLGQVSVRMPADAIVDLAEAPKDRLDGISQRLSCPVHPIFSEVNGMHQLGVVQPDPMLPQVVSVSDRTLASDAALGFVSEASDASEWRELGVELVPINSQVAQGIAQLEDESVVGWTFRQCDQVYVEGVTIRPYTLVVADEPDLDDATYFWNLRASQPLTRGRSTAALVTRTVATNAEFIRELRRRLDEMDRPGRETKPAVILTSRSLSSTDLAEVAETMGFEVATDQALREGPRRFGERTVASVNLDPLLALPLRQDSGRRSFVPTPVQRPTTVIHAQSSVAFNPKVGGFVCLRLSNHPLIDVPAEPNVGEMYFRNARATRAGIEFTTMAQPLYEFEIALPERAEVLTAVLAARHIRMTLSDKARYAGGVLARCGDRWPFPDPLSTELITQLTTPRSAHLAREFKKKYPELPVDQTIELARTFGQESKARTLSLGEWASRLGKSEADIAERVAELVEVGLVVRGFLVRCIECGLRDFTEGAPLTGRPVCIGCGSTAGLARGASGREPGYWYRLNSLLDVGSDNGVLAQLMAIRFLREPYPECYVLPGADLTLPDGQPGEVDLIGMFRRQVFSGEAKMKRQEFTSEQLVKDRDKSSQIRAAIHVIACCEPLGDELESQARHEFGKQGIQVWFVDPARRLHS